MHVSHPDVHSSGLADGCPGCAEVAEDPIRNADHELVRYLIGLAVDPERFSKGRSETELVAAANVLNALERTGRACEIAGDLVAGYLRDRWRLRAEIEPHHVYQAVGSLSLDEVYRKVFGKSVTCPACGRTSHHPMDVLTGWCGACETFTGSKTRDELLDLAERVPDPARTALLNRIERHVPAFETATMERVGRVLDLGGAVLQLLEAGTEPDRVHELVDVAIDEWERPTPC